METQSLLAHVSQAVTTIGVTRAEVAEGHKALSKTQQSFASLLANIDDIVERINDMNVWVYVTIPDMMIR